MKRGILRSVKASYRIDLSKQAKKFIRIIKAIDGLAENPRPRWVEKLKGIKKGDYYRIPQGNYRILYTIDDGVLMITIVEVNGRDDCYKKLNKKLK
jgi:mRNA interferase RelE/StbE